MDWQYGPRQKTSTSRVRRRPAPLPAQQQQQQQQPSPSPPPNSDDDSPAQQQQVLDSLASYLEGELISRLQAYSELLAEGNSLNRERSFYRTKLLQIEKICKHVQPLRSSISKLDTILSILSAQDDLPKV